MVVVPGKPDASLLVKLLAKDADPHMPPKGQLPPDEIATLRDWVAAGAPWNKHWSLVTPQASTPPTVKQEAWSRNEVDRFVFARLEDQGLTPSAGRDQHRRRGGQGLPTGDTREPASGPGGPPRGAPPVDRQSRILDVNG